MSTSTNWAREKVVEVGMAGETFQSEMSRMAFEAGTW